jgi:hypothetical protein
MNTELIISRANELKEFKLKNEIIYIKTNRHREPIVWDFKRNFKIEEGSEASKEIDSYFDLFIPIFSLNIIMGILFLKYSDYFSFLDELIDDEIKKILICASELDVDLLYRIALSKYRDYIEEQKIEKTTFWII